MEEVFFVLFTCFCLPAVGDPPLQAGELNKSNSADERFNKWYAKNVKSGRQLCRQSECDRLRAARCCRVLGIRDNSFSMCRTQGWILTVHAAMMTTIFRPCGAFLSNMFLVLSKVGAFAIALMTLLHIVTLDNVFDSAAQMATTVSTATGSCQTIVQVLLILLSLPQVLLKLRRKLLDILRTPNALACQEEVQDDQDDIESCRLDALLMEPEVPSPAVDFSRFPNVPRTVSLAEESSRKYQMMIEARRTQAAVEHRHVQLKCLIAASHPATPQSERLALLVRAACQESSFKRTSSSCQT